jgi:hypothetical protein
MKVVSKVINHTKAGVMLGVDLSWPITVYNGMKRTHKIVTVKIHLLTHTVVIGIHYG